MDDEIPKVKPFFYDVTLRDGNQALRNPWDLQEKERVFNQLLKLGVQGIEVGFSGASEMDFKACEHLAKMSPDHVVISGLARAVERDIVKVWEAIQSAAQPRIHTFITTSPYNMENVLRMPAEKVLKKAMEAVAKCKDIMGGKGSIQFSAEHFGDCRENMDFVIETLLAVVEEGATVVNLPNTVERYRPKYFVEMVEQVVEAMPSHVTVAVHNHNDLGMATATTVESYFSGAVQLETTLNGLGERAGNTNMFEVACALYNCGVEVPLQLMEFYESALLTAEWSQIPIAEKAPIIGSDVIAHRSGIHQDGAIKTKGKDKGAYRAFDSSMIGRKEGDRLGFTSQSGKTAVFEIISEAKLPITIEEAAYLQPILKKVSEVEGELDQNKILKVYDEEILKVKGPLEFRAIETDVHREKFEFVFKYHGKDKKVAGNGTGPVEACFSMFQELGLVLRLIDYQQQGQDVAHKDFAAHAISTIIMKNDSEEGQTVIGRAKDLDTVVANVKAVFNGVNLLFRVGAIS